MKNLRSSVVARATSVIGLATPIAMALSLLVAASTSHAQVVGATMLTDNVTIGTTMLDPSDSTPGLQPTQFFMYGAAFAVPPSAGPVSTLAPTASSVNLSAMAPVLNGSLNASYTSIGLNGDAIRTELTTGGQALSYAALVISFVQPARSAMTFTDTLDASIQPSAQSILTNQPISYTTQHFIGEFDAAALPPSTSLFDMNAAGQLCPVCSQATGQSSSDTGLLFDGQVKTTPYDKLNTLSYVFTNDSYTDQMRSVVVFRSMLSSVVPEPDSMALMGLGLAGLVSVQRRRRFV